MSEFNETTRQEHPAFPISEEIYQRLQDGNFKNAYGYVPLGLTKREYFAALNLQALITASLGSETMVKATCRAAKRKGLDPDDYMAIESVAMADKLIEALNK